jgi:hypothetical protein
MWWQLAADIGGWPAICSSGALQAGGGAASASPTPLLNLHLLFAAPSAPRITVRKSRYDLGKKFFTNITPGYQQYPVVYLLPWTDPSAPGEGSSGSQALRAGL